MKRNKIIAAVALAGALSTVPFAAQADGDDVYPVKTTPTHPPTGSESGNLLQVGALLLGAGGIAVVASRRRLAAT